MSSSNITVSVRRRALVATATAAVLGLTLAACGSSDDDASSGHSSKPGMKHSASAEPGGSFNDADVTFAQQMIPHHEQAVEMAKLADGRASDTEIKTLAADIEKAQDPEISTMNGWLTSWGKPRPTAGSDMGDMPGMDHSGGGHMAGMMSDKDMSELKAAKGTPFDKKFAELMIAHHEGALAMAKDEQKNGKNADAKKLAGNIVKGQTAEITKMKQILDRL
jgi:uncharacterized protein (DUF305 family)